MRPRSAGTFLISRWATSANDAARSQRRSMSARVEVLDREQVPHRATSGVGSGTIATASEPSSSRTRTCTRSPRAVGRFLPT